MRMCVSEAAGCGRPSVRIKLDWLLDMQDPVRKMQRLGYEL